MRAELLDAFLDELADRVAAKLRDRLAPSAPERVYRDDAVSAGASWSWIEERGRRGDLVLRGPKGRRYVLRVELDALLARTSVRRRTKAAPPESGSSLTDDASAAVVELARRRRVACVR